MDGQYVTFDKAVLGFSSIYASQTQYYANQIVYAVQQQWFNNSNIQMWNVFANRVYGMSLRGARTELEMLIINI